MAVAQTRVERVKLSPDLTLGYANQSFRGYQNIDGTDKYFSGSNRFSSVQAGVAIPIFRGAQKARIEAAKLNEQVVQANYQLGLATLEINTGKPLLRTGNTGKRLPITKTRR